jgi:hypothetical protein
MRTTLDIDQTSYKLMKAISSQRGISMGKVVGEAIKAYCGVQEGPQTTIAYSSAGFPTIAAGRPITSEDVAELEDE